MNAFGKISLALVIALFSGCSTAQHCRTDACYNARYQAADPFRTGEIAAWGSEKEYGYADSDEQNSDRAPAASRRHDKY